MIIKAKRHPLVVVLLLFIILFLALFEIPEILLETQIKIQTQQILNRSDSYQFGTDNYSRHFLKNHPHLKLADVTDQQGSNGHSFYHVGKTSDDHILGLYVYYSDLNPFYSNTKIQRIKVWHN